jgi:hypothetical protein
LSLFTNVPEPHDSEAWLLKEYPVRYLTIARNAMKLQPVVVILVDNMKQVEALQSDVVSGGIEVTGSEAPWVVEVALTGDEKADARLMKELERICVSNPSPAKPPPGTWTE